MSGPLRYISQQVPVFKFIDIMTKYFDTAFRGFQKSQHYSQQCGLASSIWPDNTKIFAGMHGERNEFKDLMAVAAVINIV
jgi:hypothetical protein